MIRLRHSSKLLMLGDQFEYKLFYSVATLPHYPPIQKETKHEIHKKNNIDRLKRLPTFEEKSIELNLPKYYGFLTNRICDNVPYLKHINFVKFLTRTNIIDGWPESVNSPDIDALLPVFKRTLKSCLSIELHDRIASGDTSALDHARTKSLIRCVHRAAISALCNHLNHLLDYQTDVDARVDAFWFCAGVPFKGTDSDRTKAEAARKTDDILQSFQTTFVCPLLARSVKPLPPFLSGDHPAAIQGEPIEDMWRVPKDNGCFIQRRHGTNVMSVWPGAEHSFAPISFYTHSAMHNIERKCLIKLPELDYQHNMLSQGCLCGFSTALAQASFNGFFPFLPLVYPISNFQVFTDGFKWSFYAYQLNTIEQLHKQPTKGSPANICWSSGSMDLFLDGSCDIEMLNDQVLLKLLRVYMVAPSSEGIDNLSPYLDQTQSMDTVKDGWLRKKYMDQFFHVLSNRPRTMKKPEVYAWERIYKLYFNTRPMDARKRFFELGLNPNKRRMDDYVTPYVPKALRPGLKGLARKEAKYEKNIFHEMTRLRGIRNDDPVRLQELRDLEAWKKPR